MSDLFKFVLSHEALFSAAGVALLDLVFALNQSAASNGLLHWVYMQLKSLSGKGPDAQEPKQ